MKFWLITIAISLICYIATEIRTREWCKERNLDYKKLVVKQSVGNKAISLAIMIIPIINIIYYFIVMMLIVSCSDKKISDEVERRLREQMNEENN